MTNFDKAKESLLALDELTRSYLLLELLQEGELNFTQLSELYVGALEHKQQEQQARLSDITLAAGLMWRRTLPKRIREMAAHAIVNSGALRGAPIEAECLEVLGNEQPCC